MSSVFTIDCQYIEPEFAASFLIIEGNEAAFVENNTSHSVPLLIQKLNQQGLTPDDVKYIIITHVHLDHAGGTSALAKVCKNAQILAHPRAARHVIDPSKLVASASQVYGLDRFQKLYGLIEPVDLKRVTEIEDGKEISWGKRTLKFIHTRGHANHHMIIVDSTENTVFTGDTFGVAYPYLQKNGVFVFPSTSPTDFDCEAAIQSIEKIENLNCSSAHFTHFGKFTEMTAIASQMKTHIEASQKILDEAKTCFSNLKESAEFCYQKLIHYYQDDLSKRGYSSPESALKYMDFDLKINADGLAWKAQSVK